MRIGITRRLGACRRGVSAVEMALVLTLFLGFVFGVINVSLVLWTQASLYFAAQAAARCASASPTVCGAPASSALVEAYALNQYTGQSLGGANPFRYSASGCGHTVTGSVTFPLNTGLLNLSIPLSASSCFP